MGVWRPMQELSQVLFERSGSEEILFEPMEVDEMSNLESLLEELDVVDASSQSMSRTP
jgi:hypothetical protein